MKLLSWITGRRADSDRSPWGDFWFESTGTRSASGMRVSSDTALQLAAVYRAVALVSGHMAMLPVRAYKSGTRKQVQHPLLRLLNNRPNRWQNAYLWRQMMQAHLELRGNAYNRIIDDARGNVAELQPIHPDRITMEVLDSGEYRYRVRQQDGSEIVLPRGQVWHLRGLSLDGYTGLSVIQYARESLGLGLAAQGYGARFFANDARPSGGWIEFPGNFKDKEARQIFRESWQAAQSGASRGKVAVLENNMKYHEVGVTNEDAQFLENRKFSISEIARWFGVPPHKIGDLENATFSNIEQQALEYLQDALQPRASSIEASIRADLLFDEEAIDITLDMREFMRGDSAQRATYYHNGIQDGWLTRNEARDMESMEPLDGLDEPLRPLNMVEEDEAEDLEVDQKAGEPPAQEAKEPPDDEKGARRLRAVLQSNAERMARRIVKTVPLSTDDFAVISEALAIDADKVERWVRETPWTDETFTVPNLTASLLTLAEA